VEELFQLKLHQAIADVPPPNATIVLATGDGNVGQLSEEGFIPIGRCMLSSSASMRYERRKSQRSLAAMSVAVFAGA
jgi:hypothetical protein